MPQLISWIEPEALADVLARAGLLESRPAAQVQGEAAVRARQASSLWDEPLMGPAVPLASPERSVEAPKSTVVERAEAGRVGDVFSMPPGSTLQGRLKALLAWVLHQTACRSLFVVDEQGLVLMEKNADPVLVAISSSFLSLIDRVYACLDTKTEASLAIDLDGGRVLQLVRADTELGKYVLGFDVGEAVRRDLVHAFRQALMDVMSEEDR